MRAERDGRGLRRAARAGQAPLCPPPAETARGYAGVGASYTQTAAPKPERVPSLSWYEDWLPWGTIGVEERLRRRCLMPTMTLAAPGTDARHRRSQQPPSGGVSLGPP